MASPWQPSGLPLVILVALMAITCQMKKTLVSIQEVSATESYVEDTLKFLTEKYNSESEDKYSFRIVRILKILKKVTDHLEFHVNAEMQRTTCKRPDTDLCEILEGRLQKKIQCYFTVFVVPWFDTYKLLHKNCTDV